MVIYAEENPSVSSHHGSQGYVYNEVEPETCASAYFIAYESPQLVATGLNNVEEYIIDESEPSLVHEIPVLADPRPPRKGRPQVKPTSGEVNLRPLTKRIDI